MDQITLHPKSSTVTWTQLAQKFSGGFGPRAMAFSPDGASLVTAQCNYIARTNGHEHYVEIWDVMASHRTQYIPVDTWIETVAFSSDGKTALVVLISGVLLSFEASTGLAVGGLSYIQSGYGASLSPNGSYCALAPKHHYRDIIETETGRSVLTIPNLISLRFSPNSQQVVTWVSDDDDEISLWHIGTATPLWIVKVDAQDLCFFGQDTIAVRCRDNVMSIRSALDGSEITSWLCNRGTGAMAWLHKGYSFMCWGGGDNTLKVYDETGKTCIQSLPATMQSVPTLEHEGGRFAYSVSTNCVAWAGNSGIWYWDLGIPGPAAIDDNTRKLGSTSASELLFYDQGDDNALLVYWAGSELQLQRLCKGRVVHSLTATCDYRPEFEFSPDGKTLVACDVTGIFQTWDTNTGLGPPKQCMHSLRRPLRFSPDSRYVALPLGRHGLHVWDLHEQRVISELAQHTEEAVFSNNSQSMAVAHEGNIEIWTIVPLNLTCTFEVAYNPPEGYAKATFMLMAFSIDDHAMAIATNGVVTIWELGDAKPRWLLQWDFEGWPQRSSIAMSEDRSKLALTIDSRAMIWCLERSGTVAPEPLQVIIPHKTRWCRFSTDGSHLFVQGGKIMLSSDEMTYNGLGVSEDRSWIMRDRYRLLYLPEEYRPRDHPATSWVEEVAFTENLVAMATGSGRVHILRFL